MRIRFLVCLLYTIDAADEKKGWDVGGGGGNKKKDERAMSKKGTKNKKFVIDSETSDSPDKS